MTYEQKQRFYTLARSIVRPDKKSEMEEILAEAEKAYDEKRMDKSYITAIGLRMMALIRTECMVDFIKRGKELAKEVDISY